MITLSLSLFLPLAISHAFHISFYKLGKYLYPSDGKLKEDIETAMNKNLILYSYFTEEKSNRK